MMQAPTVLLLMLESIGTFEMSFGDTNIWNGKCALEMPCCKRDIVSINLLQISENFSS